MKKILTPFILIAALAGCAQAVDKGESTTVSTEPQDGVPAGWTTDYAAALKQAKAEGKDVFIDFTGSDWCGPCIRLHDEILDKPAFKDYAKENLVLLYVDFPRGIAQTEALEKQNKELASKYGVRFFPTLVVLNSEGEQLGRMGYVRGGPDPFLAELKKVTGDKES